MGFYGVLWVGSVFLLLYIYFRLFVGWIGVGSGRVGSGWIALSRLVHFFIISFFFVVEGEGGRRVALIESWIGVVVHVGVCVLCFVCFFCVRMVYHSTMFYPWEKASR